MWAIAKEAGNHERCPYKCNDGAKLGEINIAHGGTCRGDRPVALLSFRIVLSHVRDENQMCVKTGVKWNAELAIVDGASVILGLPRCLTKCPFSDNGVSFPNTCRIDSIDRFHIYDCYSISCIDGTIIASG